jgi:hypothetical protein
VVVHLENICDAIGKRFPHKKHFLEIKEMMFVTAPRGMQRAKSVFKTLFLEMDQVGVLIKIEIVQFYGSI